jgi:hypothetical protein
MLFSYAEKGKKHSIQGKREGKTTLWALLKKDEEDFKRVGKQLYEPSPSFKIWDFNNPRYAYKNKNKRTVCPTKENPLKR